MPSAGAELWSLAASTSVDALAAKSPKAFTGCFGAGMAATLAKPDESPLGGCTPLLVLATSCGPTGNLRPPGFNRAGELLGDALLASAALPSGSAAGGERTAVRNLLPGTGCAVADGLRTAERYLLFGMGLSPGPSTRI